MTCDNDPTGIWRKIKTDLLPGLQHHGQNNGATVTIVFIIFGWLALTQAPLAVTKYRGKAPYLGH